MQTVARLNKDGNFYIMGRVIQRQTLAAATANPRSYNATTDRLIFALSNNTTVLEVDRGGNIYLPKESIDHQTLTFAGATNELNSNASILWVNIKGVRYMEITSSGWLKLTGRVVENAPLVRLL
jgi:hypothetical protein